MGSDQQDFTHEELWDDSALIDSWNEALAEYKKYHSIYAEKRSLQDLKKQVQEAESNKLASSEAVSPGLENTQPMDTADQVPATKTASLPDAPPQALLGSIRDEGLKKLLMSWYYAGYYTGLFEGQQQVQRQAQHPN